MDEEDTIQAEIDNLCSGHHRDYRGVTSEQKQLHDRVRHLCQYYLWPEYRERVKERAREASRQRRRETT